MYVLWHMVVSKEHTLVVTGWLRIATDGARNQLEGWKPKRQTWFEVLTAMLMAIQVFRDDAPCWRTVTKLSKKLTAFICGVKQSKKSHVQKPFQVYMRFKVRAMIVNAISSHMSCNTAISTAAVACHVRLCQTTRLCDTWCVDAILDATWSVSTQV